jgi:hypothetical protein
VARCLVAAGHEAIEVDLPGDDETAGVPRYTELVVNAIGSRSDVVLVAGSLGRFTAPLVCKRVPVRELVLVNAMIPDIAEWAFGCGSTGVASEVRFQRWSRLGTGALKTC